MKLGYLKFDTTKQADGTNITFHELAEEPELKVNKHDILLVADLDNVMFKGLISLMGIQTESQKDEAKVTEVKKERNKRKSRSRKTGRPVVDDKKVEMAIDLYNYNIPINDIAYHTGLSKTTIYKKVKESKLKECS